jgi:hypothetical protein
MPRIWFLSLIHTNKDGSLFILYKESSHRFTAHYHRCFISKRMLAGTGDRSQRSAADRLALDVTIRMLGPLHSSSHNWGPAMRVGRMCLVLCGRIFWDLGGGWLSAEGRSRIGPLTRYVGSRSQLRPPHTNWPKTRAVLVAYKGGFSMFVKSNWRSLRRIGTNMKRKAYRQPPDAIRAKPNNAYAAKASVSTLAKDSTSKWKDKHS